jgi:hypothetical protein
MCPAKNGVPTHESTKLPKHKTLMLVIQNLKEGFTKPGSKILRRDHIMLKYLIGPPLTRIIP